jgi:hypothetical protein
MTHLWSVQPADPRVCPIDAPRLGKQSAAILAMLREGPRTNVELARVTHRFGARIHDARRAGFRIETKARGDGSGLVDYRLVG